MRRAWIVLSILFLASPVWAARLDLSFKSQEKSDGPFRSWQAFRCDEGSAVATGSAARTAGQDCDSGDFSKAMDCRGMTTLKVQGHEYNATADNLLDIKIWDCEVSEGYEDQNLDPSGTPTDNDPGPASIKPLCVQIGPTGTTDPGGICPDTTGTGNGWQIDGSSEACRESGGAYGFIVLEIDDCGTDDLVCGDATLLVRCSP